ncbi:SurA N-terminal domain-containing protein [Micromonospora okii]|uniref:SurA N-terminal domain-containing protein n=1 Tax=Micromonospora okii TaxID=1182970 RepID=UPI001E2CCB13|nr:SurA N-terminal domain-containing protein [Micromonospora okii]
MRTRRLIAAASVAALGVLSLGACGKSAPDVAAYVGDAKFSVDRVDEIYDNAQGLYAAAVSAEAAQAGATPGPAQLRSDVTRQDVLDLLVSVELGKRVVAAQGIQVPDEVKPEQLERQLRVPAAAEYTRLWSEWVDISAALGARLPTAEVNDEAVMAVYRAIEKTGAIQSGMTVSQVRQAFGESGGAGTPGGFVRGATALSAALQAEAEKAGSSVNPRYRPVGVPSVVSTGQSLIFYSLPFIDEDGPVTDISTPQAPSGEPSAPAAPGV